MEIYTDLAAGSRLLRSPVSGRPLELRPLAAGGVLVEPGRRWPVVAGIACLRETPGGERVLAALEAGDEGLAAAVLAAEALGSRVDRVRERLGRWLLRRPPGHSPAVERSRRRLAAGREGGFAGVVKQLFGRPPWPVPATAEYFLRRRADPSFAAAEALAGAMLADSTPVLDVGCGAGHLLCSLAGWDPRGRCLLVGLDELFPALLAARELLGPRGLLVWGEAGCLPLASDAFGGLASVDAVFDFPRMASAVAEMERVRASGAPVLLAHLHNRLRGHLYEGRTPLSPGEWLELLEPLEPVALLDERVVLGSLLGEGAWRLDPSRDVEALEPAADLVAVAGVERIAASAPPRPAKVGAWRLNPAYRVKDGEGAAGDALLFRGPQRYISEKEEAGGVEGFLPREVAIPAAALAALPAVELPAAVPPALVAARVVLPLPPGLGGDEPAVVGPGWPPPADPRPRRGGPLRALREARSRLRTPSLVARLRARAAAAPEGRLGILMGHQVTRRRGPDPLDLRLPLATLQRHVETLGRIGDFLDPVDAFDRLKNGNLPPGLSFTLTFDDGTADMLDILAPWLERAGLRAALFVTGPFAACCGHFYWDLQRAGGLRVDPALLAGHPCFELGHHTHAHLPLEPLGDEALARQLEPLPHVSRPWIAYPLGTPAAVGPRAVAAARAAGFEIGLTTTPGLATARHDPLRHPRMPLVDAPTSGLLRTILSSLV
ncbi:MAG: methyltransferase domain-containing protein [Acidobacteriota bacterium]|nr:methyltransferase domain-containing protein [Acidobacteriota bacterium]MDQ7087739.1 methyltransferase domain-containing protein [Acidobacteriota bacterium]